MTHPEASGHPDSILPTRADLPDGWERRPAAPGMEAGHVHLKASDLERQLAFYRDVIGLGVWQREERVAFLGAGGYHHHVGLNDWHSAGGPPADRRRSGLFHLALRYPTRRALADAVWRLVDAGVPLEGASDHGVSEAIYLRDPEDNGVELYVDRPRDQWPPSEPGSVAMYTRALDLEGLLEASDPAARPRLGEPCDPGVDLGHVHLQTADVERSLRFWRDALGLDLTQRLGGQAIFLSAGGYHHHVGANSWQSLGAGPPEPGSAGLFHSALRYPSPDALADAVRNLVAAGVPLEGASDHGASIAVYLRDPDQGGLELYVDRPRERWPARMGREPVDLSALVSSM